MLSILIPVYNYSIVRLVTDLHRQALEAMIDFEIIVMEDGEMPRTKENNFIAQLEFCQHIILPQNIGRSAIRNKLADTAKYEHLLFMDGDAEVFLPNYLNKYIPFCKVDSVVIGGTAYDSKEHNPDFSLRLKYGREREAKMFELSLNTPSRALNFATFNFLISKSIFNKVRFDEGIRGYGHEDTLFGHQLHELNYEIIRIDNPLIHKGLDANLMFVRKTCEATRNLYLLYKTGRYPFLLRESKLLNTFVKLKSFGLLPFFALLFKLFDNLIKLQLSSLNPSLRLYDLYKLLFLCNTSFKQ
jgi:glycosyltransferase involved in cell wall biosynthesis